MPELPGTRHEQHVRWSSETWRVVELRVYCWKPGTEEEILAGRGLGVEAKVGDKWVDRPSWSTDGVVAMNNTIFDLVDQLDAERKRAEEFKQAIEAATKKEPEKASEPEVPKVDGQR